MTNHPNRGRSYWRLHPRRFYNEYTIGVATTQADAEQYEAEGYARISREDALYLLSRRPGSGEQMYVSAQIDGRPIYEWETRYEFARWLRRGEVELPR